MTTPINPNELISDIKLPDKVIEAINTVLKEQWVYGRTTMNIKQELFAKEIRKEMNIDIAHRQEVYDNGYMDFEKVFEKEGWEIEYHTPDRDESYDAYYKFTAP